MKALVIVVTLALLVSCQSPTAYNVLPFGLNPMCYEVLHEDLDTVWPLVASMQPLPDPQGYQKSPIEFWADRGGDCEDFAIALMYYLGPEASLVIIQYPKPEYLHAIIRYQDRYLEPQRYNMYFDANKITIVSTEDYLTAMRRATLCGTK